MTFYLVIFFISLLSFSFLGYSYSETSGTDSGVKNITNTTGTSSSMSIIDEFNFTNIIKNALSSFNSDDYKSAIMWYNKAINLEPLSIEAINGKGLSLSELGKHQEAIKLYDKALKIDPSLLVSIYYKTRSLEELGESQLAAEYFKNASNIYYERSVN